MSEEKEKDKTAGELPSEQHEKQVSDTDSISSTATGHESNPGAKDSVFEEKLEKQASEQVQESQSPDQAASGVKPDPTAPEQKLETVKTDEKKEVQKEQDIQLESKPVPAAAETEGHTDATKEVSVTAETEKPKRAPLTEEEKAARIQAAAEARAARVKSAEGGGEASTGTEPAAAARPPRARVREEGAGDAAEKPERPARAPRVKADEEPPKPKEPSPKQPVLDQLVALLKAEIAEEAVEESFINEMNDHLPTVTVKNEHWLAAADLLRKHGDWSCDYLRNLSGTDQETHLEVIYHLINLNTRAEVAVRVKTDREAPSIASVTPIWPTADWNEREVYDLLGIDFPGHPDLRRIMMPDDWVGHPLRKDYVPLDSEV
ncbi:NADH-quinone oxidoreductase subunit C [Paenibacillus alvei]|uniref:NADH-quinone oxidoreductase subunit C n=1 Tax=Paenibacillus alvei TaxID=44250 RepID=UPI0018CE5493|nr:NADH-quinone oxidoreductase subunit C [Paenibacillus alvei]MBG9735108.1 NuoC [Paenibacillus alvei]MBG9743566.1 NuoC [Paenibacillus alvei]MCY9579958.1 NADH-quinone oxidoreductase subunit C [Paenibacillus alvei]MCY9584134.1 NADH-quinone oxidoreductase subunit C [Paenibacillus alvei]